MATRNSNYAAMPFNKYYTPGWTVTRDLASLWTPPRNCSFWEPCAGNGTMARAITRAWGQVCLATDLEPDSHQLVPIAKLDFLRSSGPSSAAGCPKSGRPSSAAPTTTASTESGRSRASCCGCCCGVRGARGPRRRSLRPKSRPIRIQRSAAAAHGAPAGASEEAPEAPVAPLPERLDEAHG